MKFDGTLPEAEVDARAAVKAYFSIPQLYPSEVLQTLLMEFAKAGYNHARKAMGSGPTPCGEITLGPMQIATGKLEVPHSACQTCGEVISPIGVDRFGYKHPDVHASSFGFPSSYFPVPASNFQAEYRKGSDEEPLRKKENVLKVLDWRCQCGEMVTASYTDANGKTHVCES